MKLFDIYKNPVPDGAFVGAIDIKPALRLRYAVWAPTAGTKKGTVCVFQGRSEFIEKYFETISDLRRRGYWVATLDWRGQGGSSRLVANPHKGYVANFSQYVDDVTIFMRQVVLPDCPGPFYAVGHSMGGHVLLRQAGMGLSPFDRLVLSAPMLGLNRKLLGHSQELVAKVMTMAALSGFGKLYVPGGDDSNLNLGPFEENIITSNRYRYERNKAILKAHPSLSIGSPTIGWLNAAMRSVQLVMRPHFAQKIKMPILLIGAGADQIVSNQAMGIFAEDLKNGQHLIIPHARHEILQETDDIRDQFWAAFDAFVPGEVVV